MRFRKKNRIKRIRNADAQRFLNIVKTRKRQEKEIEEMNQSFYQEDEIEQGFMRAIQEI